jgi:hypothetical protein
MDKPARSARKIVSSASFRLVVYISHKAEVGIAGHKALHIPRASSIARLCNGMTLREDQHLLSPNDTLALATLTQKACEVHMRVSSRRLLRKSPLIMALHPPENANKMICKYLIHELPHHVHTQYPSILIQTK